MHVEKVKCIWSIPHKCKIREQLPVATKKYFESPYIPIVPGPTISAKTLTVEKAPERIPKPRPETETKNTMISIINVYI